MKKSICICSILGLILLFGCANYLLYKPDFEESKNAYYTRSLNFEDQLQKTSIEKIRRKLQNLLELCYVLYHRFPTKHDRYEVLEINLKLTRLARSIEILEEMRKNFYKGFHLVFSREDFVFGPLQLQSSLEVQYMSNFLDILNEHRSRINYIDRFRKECLLETGLQEEKLEGVDSDLHRIHKEIAEIIYVQISEYLRNVGIVITRNPNFNFEFSKGMEPQKEADKEAESALMAAGKKTLLENVSGYTYYFESERREFHLAYQDLKASIERFHKTIEDFKKHASQKPANREMDIQLAEQSRQITVIMEEMANRIKNIFDEALSDVNKLVGPGIREVDDTLWPKLKAETDEVAKKKNFDYYQGNIVEFSALIEKMLRMDKPESDAYQLREHLVKLGKNLQEKTGIWGPGYNFLNTEWQEKVSINRLDDTLTNKLKELENYAIQAIRPFWKTCSTTLKKQDKEVPYKLDAKGYLIPEEK